MERERERERESEREGGERERDELLEIEKEAAKVIIIFFKVNFPYHIFCKSVNC